LLKIHYVERPLYYKRALKQVTKYQIDVYKTS